VVTVLTRRGLTLPGKDVTPVETGGVEKGGKQSTRRHYQVSASNAVPAEFSFFLIFYKSFLKRH